MRHLGTRRWFVVRLSTIVALALVVAVALAAFLRPSVRDPFDRHTKP